MEVRSIKYFGTNKGIGYVAKTDLGSIVNDGDGSGTYFQPSCDEGKKYKGLQEEELNHIVDVFEGVAY